MEVTARLNNLRMGPRKVRLLADLIRGRDLNTAVDMLSFQAKRAAKPLQKLLLAAAADAQHNFQLDPAQLKVKRLTVDQGMTLKRFTPKAFGRAAEIRKRGSRVTVTLEGLIKRTAGKGKEDKSAVAVVEAEAAPVATTTKRGTVATEAVAPGKGTRVTPKATGRRLFSRKTG